MDWNAIAACTDISLGIWDLRFDHFIWSIFFGNYIICVFPGDKHVYTLPTFDFSRNNSMKLSTPMTVQYSRFDGISLAINLHSEIWSFFKNIFFSSSKELILRNLEFFKHFFFFFESVIVNMGKQKPIMCYDYVVSTRRDNFISLYSTRKFILYFLEN